MSVQYQREIFSKGSIKLFLNFGGVAPEDCSTRDQLSLCIYAIDASSLKCVFSETLNYEQVLDLFSHLNSVSILRDSSRSRTGRFVEVTDDVGEMLNLIRTVDSRLVKAVLDRASEGQKLKLVLEALSEGEVHDLQASIRQAHHEKSLSALKRLIELEATTDISISIKGDAGLVEFVAGQPEKIFQNWIERNTWCLGIEYIKRHPARQIGIGSESDLIMESTDGFIDLIELKRPKFELLTFDSNHKSFYPSVGLSKVIGQCMKYLKVLDEYKLVLEKEHRFRLLRPRIKIIAGRTQNFSDEKHEALRMLNSIFNHIQVISYDYLCQCGENLIAYYKMPGADGAAAMAKTI